MAIWSRFFGNAASSAAGFGIGAAVSPALRPITQEVANETWSLHANRPVSVAEAAEAEVRGILNHDQALTESLKTGYNTDRYNVIHGLAGQPPGGEQLLELLNRGEITDDDVTRGLRQSRMRPEWYAAYKELRNVLVPVSDLVRMAVREVFTPSSRRALDLDAEFPGAFATEAAKLGLSEKAARDYWAAHWELPSYTQGTQMLFRGEISQAEFEGLLKALDYAPTWRKSLGNIARAIPGVSDMIRFAVREVYDPASRKRLGLDQDYPPRFTTEAAKHGLSEEHAKDYWAAHWQLPSPTQGYRMLWRGEITKAELDGLLKALDYSPAWRDKLSNIAHLVPGRVDLRRMFAAGILTRAEVKAGYIRLGYTDKDAEILTTFAVQLAAGGDNQKEATKSELADEFAAGYITEAELRAALTALGYVGKQLEVEVGLQNARRIKRYREKVITVLQKAYMTHNVSDDEARARLAAVNVTGEAANRLLPLWQMERDIMVKELTPAQIKKAYKKGLMTEQQSLDELDERGYSVEDARTFLAL